MGSSCKEEPVEDSSKRIRRLPLKLRDYADVAQSNCNNHHSQKGLVASVPDVSNDYCLVGDSCNSRKIDSQDLVVKKPTLIECQYCGKNFKCINKHIAAVHPDEFRKYTSSGSIGSYNLMEEIVASPVIPPNETEVNLVNQNGILDPLLGCSQLVQNDYSHLSDMILQDSDQNAVKVDIVVSPENQLTNPNVDLGNQSCILDLSSSQSMEREGDVDSQVLLDGIGCNNPRVCVQMHLPENVPNIVINNETWTEDFVPFEPPSGVSTELPEFRIEQCDNTLEKHSNVVNIETIDSNEHQGNEASQGRTPCQYCGKLYKCVNKHIVAAHPEEYRQRFVQKYSKPDNASTSDTNKSNGQNDVEKLIIEWSNKPWGIMDLETLDKNVDDFQKFLKDVIHKLPGPKHPGVKYFEMRKNKKNGVVSQNSRHTNSSNPERKTKRARNKRKEAYMYEAIQFQYFNCRKKAVRKIIGDDSRSCPLKIQEILEYYQSTLGIENTNTDHITSETSGGMDSDDSTDSFDILQDEVDEAIKRTNMDSSAGPDGVLTRAIRVKGVNVVLFKIFNRMIVLGKLVPCLKTARTVLIDKGGQADQIKNWRPISILPMVRRVFEKIIEKKLRDYAVINSNQRGFISVPGCSTNLAIVEKALETAKKEKSDLVCIFLDINQAYNNIGHEQVRKSLERTKAPSLLKNIIMECETGNRTFFEVGADKSSSVLIKKGLMQGAPLSPLLYNMATNHIIDEITEEGLVKNFGVKIVDSVNMVGQAFADDICLMCKSLDAAKVLYEIIKTRLQELGMNLNPAKTQSIVLEKGIIKNNEFSLDNVVMNPASLEKKVKYLGTTLTDQIVLDKETTVKTISEKIDKVTKSPYLKSDQKMTVLNTYIWPMLVYKLQNTPVDRWSIPFVDDLDKMVRSAVKQVLDLPKDVPDAALYSNMRGLQVFRFSWEIIVQRLNLFINLQKQGGVIQKIKDLDDEIKKCLVTLNISNVDDINVKSIRKSLRSQEFHRWEEMKMKGAGVCLFKEVEKHNKWLTTKEGLSTSEFTELIKMSTNTCAVRAIPGRSQDGAHCRRCPPPIETKPTETLGHVLGSCPFGQLARINRHNTIRSILAVELKKQYDEVYEEVSGIASDGSSRRIDIIAIDRKNKKGIIVDPTIRIESTESQPHDVNDEKRNIYIPTIPYYKNKYGLNEIEVIGLLIGARGTITSFFKNFAVQYNISEATLKNIAQTVVRSSILILRTHIYGV